jgi:hypothetical protein
MAPSSNPTILDTIIPLGCRSISAYHGGQCVIQVVVKRRAPLLKPLESSDSCGRILSLKESCAIIALRNIVGSWAAVVSR